MRIPTATYRIQFQPEFTFQKCEKILKYLSALGISDIYASPILRPRKGSTHGYDVVNPDEINEELGGESAFLNLTSEADALGIKWLQDIVPNHMAFSTENEMLREVLEYGENSEYFNFFDIDWNHPAESLKGRLLTPMLGKPYAECLESGEIQLSYADGDLEIVYYSLKLPVKLDSYIKVFSHDLSRIERQLGSDNPAFIKFLGSLRLVENISARHNSEKKITQITHAKKMLWEIYRTEKSIADFIESNIAFFNGESEDKKGLDLLDEVLSEQYYRLSFWKVAAEELNYRRFFNINELICLRVENEYVFKRTHSKIFSLFEKGKIAGLRIDHIDGLYDPTAYLLNLRKHLPQAYIVVEKILESDEKLPKSWPIQGETGYRFLNLVNGLFCMKQSSESFSRLYNTFTRMNFDFEELVTDKKRLIIGKHMAGNIDNLATFITNIAGRNRYGRDITLYGLRRALVEVMAYFPTYRTYVDRHSFNESDRQNIRKAIKLARKKSPGHTHELNYIEKFLLMDLGNTSDPGERNSYIDLMMMFQQFTGPLMAKGFEDTVLYIFNKLVSLNEVGGNPKKFGTKKREFHDFNSERRECFPHALNATSTHDTKRGEDVRARINVLSEIPGRWQKRLKFWAQINAPKKKHFKHIEMPDRNDEYLIYQTLIGCFPFGDFDYNIFCKRMQDYIVKAIREAKVHTGWIKPDIRYEQACVTFVEKLLEPSPENEFLKDFTEFQKITAFFGMLNGLAQTLIKITAPGIPDFYQGSELWELSLVDPDNRRPVDFGIRADMLAEIMNRIETDFEALLKDLIANPQDGRIKLFTIHRALKARNALSGLFREGSYIPIVCEGSEAAKKRVLSFAREFEGNWAITVIPRFFAGRLHPGSYPTGESVWNEAELLIPECKVSVWIDAITGNELAHSPALHLKEILNDFPVALLIGKSQE